MLARLSNIVKQMNSKQVLSKMKENGIDYTDNRVKSTPVAMVAPELKQNADTDTEITKTCAVLGCDDSKNLSSEEFFRFPENNHYRQIWTDLTGRSNWTPTDYSYICIQHFSVDSFACNADGDMLLVDKAVPSLKLPGHVLEVEYIDEETLDNDYQEDDDVTECETDEDQKVDSTKSKMNGNTQRNVKTSPKENIMENIKENIKENITENIKENFNNIEVLKLFTEVQMMQKEAISLKNKLRMNMKIYNKQNRFLSRLKHIIDVKKEVLNLKRQKKARILLSLQDKMKEDTSGLVMAMPTKHTDELKDFALTLYRYSPQAYIYTRNTLRTMLPSTELLSNWLNMGYKPKNVMTSSNSVKLISQQTESELSCKVVLS